MAYSHPVAPSADPAYSVAVYDVKTGKVLQIHHFSAMPGVEFPDRERLHAMALALAARRHKRESASMEVLRIDQSTIQRKRSYRVSLPDRRLVEDRAAQQT